MLSVEKSCLVDGFNYPKDLPYKGGNYLMWFVSAQGRLMFCSRSAYVVLCFFS